MKTPLLAGAVSLFMAFAALANAEEPASPSSSTQSPSSQVPSPLGDWSRGDGKAKVRIAPCGKDICAVNTWIKPGHNEEKVGDKLIMTVTPAGAIWTGKAFDPQRKLTYRLTLTVKPKTMTTRGCVLGGLVCKGTDWTRIAPAA